MKKIVFLLLALLMCFSFCSCSTVDKETIISEAETSIENAFLKLSNNDIEADKYMDINAIETKLSNTLADVDAYYGTDKFLNLWLPTVSCSVESSEFIDENTVNFTVNITSASMWDYYRGYSSAMLQDIITTKSEIDSFLQGIYVEPSYRTESEMANEFIDAGINEAIHGQKCTNQTNITVTRIDGEWKFEMSDEVCVAILGDIDEATNNYANIMR